MMSPSEIARQAEDRHLHLGILGTKEQFGQLDYIPIFKEEAALYCGPGHSLFSEPLTEFDEAKLRGMRYVGRTHNSHSDMLAPAGFRNRRDVPNFF